MTTSPLLSRPKPVKAPGPASSRQTRGVNHAELVKQVKTYVEAHGGWILKYFAGGIGAKPGMPDFIAGFPIPHLPFAAFLGIECKTGTATLNDKQVKIRTEMRAARITYFEVRSIEDLEGALLHAGLLETPSLLRFGGE